MISMRIRTIVQFRQTPSAATSIPTILTYFLSSYRLCYSCTPSYATNLLNHIRDNWRETDVFLCSLGNLSKRHDQAKEKLLYLPQRAFFHSDVQERRRWTATLHTSSPLSTLSSSSTSTGCCRISSHIPL